MKRLSIFLLMAIMAVACSKDDDSDNNDDPGNDTSSFSLENTDGSIDLSGTATLNPSLGMDSLISISMVNEGGNANVSLALYSKGDAWSRDQFSIDSASANANQTFLMSLSMESNSVSYLAYQGDIDITDKTKNERLTGNFDVRMMNPMTSDTISVSGDFNALSQF